MTDYLYCWPICMDFWYVFVLLHALNSCTHLVVVLSEEQIKECQELGVLVDRDDQGVLLQIFTKPAFALHVACRIAKGTPRKKIAKGTISGI